MNFLMNNQLTKIKFVNIVKNSQPVHIFVNDKPVARGLHFNQSTDYIPVPRGNINVKVYGATTGRLLDNRNIMVNQNKLIILGDDLTGKLNLFFVDDIVTDMSLSPISQPMYRVEQPSENIIKKVVDEFRNVYEVIVNTAGVVLKDVQNKLGNIFISAGDRIKRIIDRMGNVIEVIVNTTGRIVARVIDDLGDIAMGTVSMIGKMVKRVVNEFGEFVDAVVDEFENVVGWVIDGFGNLVSGIANNFDNLASAIKGEPTVTIPSLSTTRLKRQDFLNGNIIKKVVDEFENVYEVIVNTAGVVINDVINKLGNIFIKAGDRIKRIVDQMGRVFEVIVNSVGKIVAQVIDDLGDIAIGTVNMIGKMITRVVNEFGEFVDAVVDEFENVIGYVIDEFGNLVSGIADSLDDLASAIKNEQPILATRKVDVILPNGTRIRIE